MNATLQFYIFYLILGLAEDFSGFVVMRLSGVETNFGGKGISRLTVLEKIDSHKVEHPSS